MTTRDRMLDAAAHVMRTKGLARATTKEIAKAAGFSEAALYKHFTDKTDLFLAVLRERAPTDLAGLLAGLEAGRGDVRETLVDVARAAIAFYVETFPIAASIFSEPALLAAHREALRTHGVGPGTVPEMLARYLEAERGAGRLPAVLDTGSAADLLLGACQYQAFLGFFSDRPADPEALVRTLWDGIGQA
ncbi:TetR family transcriptional regulator [Saccharothrix carnea]|uniref:TetR family transcriptional regulator n=1 Tax=Saccharothrix carnea TaxID=1280637 RepID=A0A2P8IDD2_SACCR|nr:TetR/AcrR family transcriptional regulator [Saccharothrix carnea]PSL56475.1 TetR family transcriptional regulator [Saccharothrix carnea]